MEVTWTRGKSNWEAKSGRSGVASRRVVSLRSFPWCRAACATHLRFRATRRHASTGVSPFSLACGFQPGGERQGTVLRREDLARPQRVSLVPEESGSGAEPAAGEEVCWGRWGTAAAAHALVSEMAHLVELTIEQSG